MRDWGKEIFYCVIISFFSYMLKKNEFCLPLNLPHILYPISSKYLGGYLSGI